jgi:hypothetical protein
MINTLFYNVLFCSFLLNSDITNKNPEVVPNNLLSVRIIFLLTLITLCCIAVLYLINSVENPKSKEAKTTKKP